MEDYSPAEIVDMLLILGEAHQNYRLAARLYEQRYPARRHPNDTTIRYLRLRAQQGNLNRRRQRREYDDNDVRVLTILAIIHLNPHISSREIERYTGIPQRTIIRILHSRKYHPYHITLTQALTANDCRLRIQFCQWAQRMIAQDPDFFYYVLFSDEATFKNTGEVNRHNCHYWSDENPHWFRPVDNQHRWSLNVWCGIINGYLIGPFFFDEPVNQHNFLNFLRDSLPELLENVDLATRLRMWFQLDGAAPHYARIVRNFLNRQYPDRWIGRGGPIPFPARSPDLTSPDFYLWGYIKNVVYQQEPTTRENMKERIHAACRAIPRDTLLRTVENFQMRVDACIQVNGRNFEQLLQ